MEQKVKISMKLVAFIMALFMILVSVPVSVFATSAISASSSDDTSTNINAESETVKKDVIVLEEDKTLRDENTKYFKLSDGTTKAVVYSQGVHFKDADGNWVDIDNTLTLNGSEYSSNNKQSIKFANKSSSNGLVSIKDGDFKIDFTPLNTNKVSAIVENPQKNNSRKFDDVKALRNLVSKVTYSNIYNGIDIEYILMGNNIKENIIVNSKQDSYVYSFELKLNKLTAELSNGSIVLSDSTTGENMYVIPAPYMYDANGVMSIDVEYSLVQNNKWKYTFTVTANTEWINAEDRAFPVTIDPTVVADIIDTDTFVMSDNGDYWDMGSLIIGNFMGEYLDSPGFMKFNTIPDIPEKSILVQAEIAMFLSYVENTDNIDFYIGVYKATKNWINDNNFSYATSSQYYDATSPINSVQIGADGSYEWDITSLYKQWKSGTANHGVCVKAVGLPADKNANVRITTIENTGGYLIPQLELTYVDARGIEDYYSYVNTVLGTVGESYVNLYNGSLTYVNNLTILENQILPYEINMIYNSFDETWTPSFNENIQPYDDFSDGIVRYVWTDTDGTKHNFAPYLQKNYWGAYVQYEESAVGDLWYVSNPVTFYPEDDIDYVLTKTTNGDFILKNYDGTQKYFNSSGELLKICDSQGNTLFFSYENGNLSFIDCKTNNNEIIAQASFSYENDNLVSVYNYTNKLEVSLSWGDNGLSNIEYNETDDTKDNIVNFNYIANSSRIYKISDTLASKYVNYTVNTNGTISAIKVYNSSDALQYQYNIVYNFTNTVCTYLGTNTSSSVEYTFDERGRNASITYDDSILPDDAYYNVEYSQNIYNQGGNLVKHDMTTGEESFFNVIEQNISFDLTDITTNYNIPAEGNSRDMVCKIIANFSDGTIGHSTGFLVGPNTLIMSAHGVLQDTTNDGTFNLSFPTSITVTPGCNKNGETAPYGNFQVTTCFVQKEYYYLEEANDSERHQYDWAVCTLNETIGNQLDWFELIVPDENIIDQYALVYGYNGTTVSLRRVTGRIIEFQGEEVVHLADTAGGMSGGPTFLCNTDFVVFGIHVAEDENAYAKRIDPIIYTLVSNLNSVEQE